MTSMPMSDAITAVTVLKNFQMDQWDSFVASHKFGSLYHTSQWGQLVEQSYGRKPLYLVLMDENGGIEAGLPVYVGSNRLWWGRMSTVPCAQCCNPLVTDKQEFNQLINYLHLLFAKYHVSYYELKTSEIFSCQGIANIEPHYDYSVYKLNIARPLETIWAGLHKSCVQRSIRKTEQNGLQLRVAESEGDVRLFYNLYAKMRKHNGLLPQPYSFFANMWEIFSRQGAIEILHAEYQKQVISSLLLLKYKDTVVYEYGATDKDMLHLHPSHFLLWAAIQRAHSEGYSIFDFGRTSDDNKGLNEFKLHWGAQREQLASYFYPQSRRNRPLRQNELLRQVMHKFVRFAPQAFCGFMGKILYRNLV